MVYKKFYTAAERSGKSKFKSIFYKKQNASKNSTQPKFNTLKYLHESLGNQKIAALVKEGIIQPRLLVNQVGDTYEIEANRVAKELHHAVEKKNKAKSPNRAVQSSPPAAVIRPVQKNQPQKKKSFTPKAINISRKKQKPVDPQIEKRIKGLSGGEPIEPSMQEILKSHYNYDVSKIRVHRNSKAARLAGSVNARAFTYRNQIVFGHGMPKPGTKEYIELMAHEVTHVVQQDGNKQKPVVQRWPWSSDKKEDKEEKKGEPGGFIMWLFENALKLVGIDLGTFKKVLGNAISMIGEIIKDPGKFLNNLIAAVKGGIGDFIGNILTHLKNGISKWIFGNLSSTGITLPEKFDLKGVFSIIGQVLNLGYQTLIRGRLVKELGSQGEKVVSTAERSVPMVKDLAEKGPMGLFEHMKESITSLPGMILGSIIEWARNTIVVKAMARILLMLNPAGAIIGIIKTIYDVVMFFVNNWKNIVEFASAVVNSLGEIARGNVQKARGWVEKSLANAIPVLLGFLAQFAGLSGIAKRVLGIIKKVKSKIEKPIGKVVKKIAGVIKKTPIYKMITTGMKKVDKSKKNINKKIDDTKKKVDKKIDKTIGLDKKSRDKKQQSREAKKRKADEAKKEREAKKRKQAEEKRKKQLEEKKKREQKKLADKKKKDEEKARKKAESDRRKKGKEDKKKLKKELMAKKKARKKPEKKKKRSKVLKWWKTKRSLTNKGGHKHKIFFAGEGKAARLKVASTPVDAIEYLRSVEVKNNPTNKPIQQKAGHIIGKIIAISKKFPDNIKAIQLTSIQEQQQRIYKAELDAALDELKAVLGEISWKNPPEMTKKSIIVDSNVAMTLIKHKLGKEKLQEGQIALIKKLSLIGEIELRASNITIGEILVKEGLKISGIKVYPFPISVARNSEEYKKMLDVLKANNVGETKGNADRKIVADAFFSAKNKGEIPTFTTHDKGIYNRLLLITGINPEKLGASVPVKYPSGFNVTINGWTLKIIPLPKKDTDKADDIGNYEISINMGGEQHSLIINNNKKNPEVDMASERESISKKTGVMISALVKLNPKPTEQINDLIRIGQLGKSLTAMIQRGDKPDIIKKAANELANEISGYGRKYKAEDIGSAKVLKELMPDKKDDKKGKDDKKAINEQPPLSIIKKMGSALKILEAYGKNWFTAKKHLTTKEYVKENNEVGQRQNIMQDLVNFRGKEYKEAEKKVLSKAKSDLSKREIKTAPEAFTGSGSSTITSDIDVTFKAPGNEDYETEMVKYFNDLFKNKYGVSSGVMFDINAYTQGFTSKAAGKKKDDADKQKELLGGDNSSQYKEVLASTNKTQLALGLLPVRQFFGKDNEKGWKDFFKKTSNDIKESLKSNKMPSIIINDLTKELAEIINQAESLYKETSDNLSKQTELTQKEKGNLSETHIKSLAKDALYEKQLETVSSLLQERERLSKTIEELMSNEKALTQAESARLESLRTLLGENMKKFDIEQGKALVYANEAYYNAGAALQVVSKGEKLNHQQLMESILMNVGYKIQHFTERKETGGLGDASLNTAKYGDRIREAIKKLRQLVTLIPEDKKLLDTDQKIIKEIKKNDEIKLQADKEAKAGKKVKNPEKVNASALSVAQNQLKVFYNEKAARLKKELDKSEKGNGKTDKKKK